MSSTTFSQAWFGLAVLFASTSAAAQGQVWVVDFASGPGADFSDIQSAVDAAADGDTILVRFGTYPAFTIGAKGLTVTAELGDGVAVSGAITVRDLGGGQHVVVRGINAIGVALGHAFVARSNLGSLWVEDGVFVGPGASHEGHAVLVEDCAAVVLARCTLQGGAGKSGNGPTAGGSGLRADRSSVAAFDCAFYGGNGGDSNPVEDYDGGGGGHGVWNHEGFVYLDAATCVGAKGGNGGSDYDGVFGGGLGCGYGGAGGSGLYLDSSLFPPGAPPTAHYAASTFDGGIGGFADDECFGYGGSPGAQVKVVSGLATSLSATATSLSVNSPVRELDTATLRFHAQPGDLAFAVVSGAPEFLYLDAFQGVFAAGLPAVIQFAGVVPAGEYLLVPLLVPLQAPGTESVLLRAQGAFFRPATVEIFLGAPTALAILDQAF